MHLQYKTKAFVYKKKDYGEADRIFTVFTYDFGKIDIFAKAIRKIDSKLKSGIEIFSLSDLEFVEGKRKILTDAVTINSFKSITNNPEKFIVAKKIAKVLDVFIKGQQHDYQIFNLITETFEKLDRLQVSGFKFQASSFRLQVLFIYFIWNFFAVLGYSPQLLNCAHCHGKLSENELYFSNKEGGIVCGNCSKAKKDAKKISTDVVKILRIILKKDWDMLTKLKTNIETQKKLKEISKNYYLYFLSTHSFNK